ncbi:unnamed protein product [Caretta caretta]
MNKKPPKNNTARNPNPQFTACVHSVRAKATETPYPGRPPLADLCNYPSVAALIPVSLSGRFSEGIPDLRGPLIHCP